MAIATIGRVLGKAGLAYLKKNKSKIKKELDSPESKQKIQEIMDKAKKGLGKKMLTGGQAKIAAKAPPPNKLDEKDFKVLREEKAKGRGMGLQDEKVQPGKVMKARKGKSAMVPLKKGYSKTLGVFPTINKVKPSVGGSGSGMGKGTDKVSTKKAEDFMKRRKELGGGRSKLPGKIGTALGVASMLVPAAYAAAKQYKDYKSAKNRDKAKVKKTGGGMMKKYSKGGGLDMGGPKGKLMAYAKENMIKDKDRLTLRDKAMIKTVKNMDKSEYPAAERYYKKLTSTKKMGGGMMQKPMGYRSGGHYDDKNKNVVKHIRVKKKMGGGMIGPSQTPGYSKGTMVKARGCKLGRTRPTKIT